MSGPDRYRRALVAQHAEGGRITVLVVVPVDSSTVLLSVGGGIRCTATLSRPQAGEVATMLTEAAATR